MLMNPEIVEITEWFLHINPELKIEVMTNGGAGVNSLWQGLGKTGIKCNFALDGLEDTHHLYRQNTLWSTVIKNALTFIESGGTAVWKMIEFDHNRHQIEQCRKMAKELGFHEFYLLESKINRGPGPAYDQHGNLSHSIDGWKPAHESETSAFVMIKNRKEYWPILWKELKSDTTVKKINCSAKVRKDLYINSMGEVYPCCFIGHNPRTLNPEYYASNQQIKEILDGHKNNALTTPIEECIKWFDEVEKTWQNTSMSTGALIACNQNCGEPEFWWDKHKQIQTLDQ
jgi:hypothetical protein